MCALIAQVYVQSVSGVQVPLHGCWMNETHLYNMHYSIVATFEYVFQHILLCWLADLFSYKKALSGQQQQQSRFSWHLSGLLWHTKHSRLLVMEYVAIFLTCKHRLVYYMYFIAMERCYSYREPKTRYYWSNWWSIYPVSLVSLEHETSGLELILFEVFFCLQAISHFLELPDVITGVLN